VEIQSVSLEHVDGQTALELLQTYGEHDGLPEEPALARLSLGQLTLLPSQLSATSHAPTAARHCVPAVANASDGQTEPRGPAPSVPTVTVGCVAAYVRTRTQSYLVTWVVVSYLPPRNTWFRL